MRELIANVHIATASLNTSISDRVESRHGIKHTFRAVPDTARVVVQGFKLVSLGTTHPMDFGLEAMDNTIHLLESYNVKPVDVVLTSEAVHDRAWIRAKSAWVAFLAYHRANKFRNVDDSIACVVFGEMTEPVKRVAMQAELIVV